MIPTLSESEETLIGGIIIIALGIYLIMKNVLGSGVIPLIGFGLIFYSLSMEDNSSQDAEHNQT